MCVVSRRGERCVFDGMSFAHLVSFLALATTASTRFWATADGYSSVGYGFSPHIYHGTATYSQPGPQFAQQHGHSQGAWPPWQLGPNLTSIFVFDRDSWAHNAPVVRFDGTQPASVTPFAIPEELEPPLCDGAKRSARTWPPWQLGPNLTPTFAIGRNSRVPNASIGRSKRTQTASVNPFAIAEELGSSFCDGVECSIRTYSGHIASEPTLSNWTSFDFDRLWDPMTTVSTAISRFSRVSRTE